MTIQEAGALLRTRKISSVELVRQSLATIDKLNPSLNAFITITADAAMARAKRADDELSRGVDRGPLHGIPVAHKDLFDTAGVRTTYGSKIFTNHIPSQDADVVQLLDRGGAVSLGKLGLHELAYGITSANPHFGPVRNPWNPDRIPGGSSGGSGTAVATGMVMLASGTDTGGSIRIPAAFCGIAGLKPTYGLISTRGCRPLSESLDHMGPMAATVADVALGMEVLTRRKYDLSGESLRGIRVGVPENFFFDHALPEVVEATQRTVDAAKNAGAEIVSVKIEAAEELVECALAIILAEGADSATDIWDRLADLGDDVRARFIQGRAADLNMYLKAQRRRVDAARRFLRVFESCDIVLTPASPLPAPRAGDSKLTLGGKEYDVRLACTRLVRPINLLGNPALALPSGLSSDKLPLSIQLIGRHYEDAPLLRVGHAIERRIPPIIPTWN